MLFPQLAEYINSYEEVWCRFFVAIYMSNSSSSVQIPLSPASRLQTLFRLSKKLETLKELGELSGEYIRKCMKGPHLKTHFQEIYKGQQIFGETDYETSHRITLPNGNRVFVACALDALVESFFLRVAIDDTCFHCSKPIRIELSEGRAVFVEPSSVVMWLGASRGSGNLCRENPCPYINFFISPEHVSKWKNKNPEELGIMLTLQQSLELARKSYWKPVEWANSF